MPTIEEVLQGKTFQKVSKEEFALQQKTLREQLWEVANKQYMESVSSPAKFQHYLNIQSMSSHKPTNIMIGMSRYPNLGEMHEMQTWEKMGKTYIKKGERAFHIFKGDKNGFYNPVKVFEESQLQRRPKPKNILQFSPSEQINLIAGGTKVLSMVEKVQEGELNVYYNPQSNLIEVDKTLDIQKVIQGMVREYCHKSYAEHYQYDREEASFTCDCAAYMMCKKLGIEPDCTFLNNVQPYFHGADAKEVREELEAVHKTYKSFNDRVDKNIYLENLKNKEKEVEQEK